MARLPRAPALALLLAVSAAGCASLFSGAGAGGGLPDFERGLRGDLAEGRFGEALRALSEDSSGIGDDLLRLQFRGLAAHYAGQPEESSRALEAAAYMAEERYTRSLTNEALSLLTNDRIRPYRPGRVERLLIHHYGALNYLSAGNAEEAAVEARRTAHLLERVDDESPAWAETAAGRSLRSVLRRVTGVVFEAAGEENDAGVARRLAERMAPPGPERAPPADDTASTDSAGAAGAAGAPPSGDGGRVVVVVEQGFAPHRVERSVTAVLGVSHVRRLREEADDIRESERRSAAALPAGSGAPPGRRDTAAVAVSVAEELLGRAPGSRSGRVRLLGGSDDGRDGRDGDDGEDGGLRLLRLAWPELSPPVAARPVRGVRPAGADAPRPRVAAWEADLAGAVAAEFGDGQVGRVARTLLRAVSKQAAVEALADGAGDEEEGLGEALGTAASIFAAAVERADTRSWHLLPARISVLRLRLPPGEHRLSLELESPGTGGERRVDLGPVTVRPGRPSVVTHRVWPRRSRVDDRGP